MLAEVKLAYQRLSILELAEAMGNVSEACRQRGMTRTQFYEYKKRFHERGLEGLKDLPPAFALWLAAPFQGPADRPGMDTQLGRQVLDSVSAASWTDDVLYDIIDDIIAYSEAQHGALSFEFAPTIEAGSRGTG